MTLLPIGERFDRDTNPSREGNLGDAWSLANGNDVNDGLQLQPIVLLLCILCQGVDEDIDQPV
jgi:hypothetical protein